jgi:acyl-CoA thioester hydrolase
VQQHHAVRPKSFDIEHVMRLDTDDEPIVAKACSTHVMFDYEHNASLPVPDAFKTQVERFQGEI